MTKAELIAIVAEAHALSKAEAGRVLDTITNTITNELSNGSEVTISGFAKFGTVSKEARVGRNPKTGEPLNIAAKTSPKIKALKSLKDAVNK